METALISPAKASILMVPSFILYILIPVAGIALLAWFLRKRFAPPAEGGP